MAWPSSVQIDLFTNLAQDWPRPKGDPMIAGPNWTWAEFVWPIQVTLNGPNKKDPSGAKWILGDPCGWIRFHQLPDTDF